MTGLKRIEAMVAQRAESVLAALGYELVGVDCYKREGRLTVEVFLHHPDGTTIEDCERAAGPLNEMLDAGDVTDESYDLMVSSPGDRPLATPRDYQRNAGKRVEIKLYTTVNKKKFYIGNLREWEERIVIEDGGKRHIFEHKQIACVRPAFEP